MQHSQPMTEGKETLLRVDKRWIIQYVKSSLACLSLTQPTSVTLVQLLD